MSAKTKAIEILASAVAAVQPAAVSLRELAIWNLADFGGDLYRVWYWNIRKKGERKDREGTSHSKATLWLLERATEILAEWIEVESRDGETLRRSAPQGEADHAA